MITLVRICGQNWHAVERDLISLGFRRDDVGSKLTVWELVSIVVSAPPGSAVYHAETRSGTYTPEAQLLSNLASDRGIAAASGSNPTPPPQNRMAQSLDQLPPSSGRPDESLVTDYCGIRFDSMTVDELLSRRKQMMDNALEHKTSDRVIVDKLKQGRG